MIVGNLGSVVKMEVSIIGDAVNLASRLESLTKEYHLDLLVGETAAAQVRDLFVLRSVDLVQVKGKMQPVAVFTIPRESGEGRVVPSWLPLYEEGIQLYRQREFQKAADVFIRARGLCPDDYLIQLYGERCAQLMAQPPGPEWSGVYQMTKK
ncbi:MAG: adenylate/guanylate cyclase domain-containing protein [Verrucomicrobiales bacterium]